MRFSLILAIATGVGGCAFDGADGPSRVGPDVAAALAINHARTLFIQRDDFADGRGIARPTGPFGFSRDPLLTYAEIEALELAH